MNLLEALNLNSYEFRIIEPFTGKSFRRNGAVYNDIPWEKIERNQFKLFLNDYKSETGPLKIEYRNSWFSTLFSGTLGIAIC